MKTLKEYILEGYEGEYYRGEPIGPYKTQEVLNFDNELKYNKDRVDNFIDTYFDYNIDFDEINSSLGQQRFLYYMKSYIGYIRYHLSPNEVHFRRKDIIEIKKYIENKLNVTLDKWEDKLKNELYDESDVPTEAKEFLEYFIDHNLSKKYKDTKKYIGNVVKFDVINYDGGNESTDEYSYRRLFRDNKDFKPGMTIYSYFLFPSGHGFNTIFITDDKFNVLYDWADEINKEFIEFKNAGNLKLASPEEVKKFGAAFTEDILNKHIGKHLYNTKDVYDISMSVMMENCPIKFPENFELHL